MKKMNSPADRPNTAIDRHGPAAKQLHPRVYLILFGSVVWFVVALWSFAGGGIADYLLFIVSGFIFVAMALVLILSRVENRTASQGADQKLKSWEAWAHADFETYETRLSGAEAAMLVLLPITTAAVGMTAIGIVFLVVAHSGV
jgi:hypothetical protein